MRAVVGGSFACDEAFARPLRALLDAVVGEGSVQIDWLTYGSLADDSQWIDEVATPEDSNNQKVDLVVLLVRVSDLETAHPELQPSTAPVNISTPSPYLPRGLDRFVSDLERYASLTRERPPVVVLFCPSPPELTEQHTALEQLTISRLQSTPSHIVKLHPSSLVLDLFQWQCPDAEFYDALADHREHAPFTLQMLNVLALQVCRQVRRVLRSPAEVKKCIVLDCDNTLWGGAVAEVGAQSIKLSPQFLSLQRFVLAQQQERGILLCLSSKNIKRDVQEVFATRREEMPIKLDEHITVAKVNWESKSSNIRAIAQELSLGLDSFVFIDDNPVECSEVSAALPMVSVIHLPEDFKPMFLEHEWVFDTPLQRICSPLSANAAATREDRERTRFYQMNKEREQLERESSTHTAFLSSLGIRIEFEELSSGDERVCSAREDTLTRVLQLHHRTNQFNTSTSFSKCLVREELESYASTAQRLVLCARVTDRFGHYGFVSSATCRAVSKDGKVTLQVDTFLLSCRALNRGVEHAMMRKLASAAQQCGARHLVFDWEPTERNQPALLFFSSLANASFAPTPNEANDNDDGSRGPEICSGQWHIAVEAARSVTFLKLSTQANKPKSPSAWIQSVNQYLAKYGLTTLWRLVYRQLLRVIAPMIRFLLPLFLRLPLTRGLFATLKSQQEPTRKLSEDTPFRAPGELGRFLSKELQISSASLSVPSPLEAEINQNELSKFRRKARHQTKLALLDHINTDTPAVIWSANRVPASSQDRNPISSCCDTPSCKTRVGQESNCAFHRCRNCCYRIQRLLHRVSDFSAHVTARETAASALSRDYKIDSDMIESLLQEKERHREQDGFCAAHQNKRRIR